MPRRRLDPAERKRVLALLMMLPFVFFFWLAFEQAGSSMNLFAERHTEHTLLGLQLTAADFQAVNPICILLFALPFAMLWKWLGARGREPSTPAKMGYGLLLEAAGF